MDNQAKTIKAWFNSQAKSTQVIILGTVFVALLFALAYFSNWPAGGDSQNVDTTSHNGAYKFIRLLIVAAVIYIGYTSVKVFNKKK